MVMVVMVVMTVVVVGLEKSGSGCVGLRLLKRTHLVLFRARTTAAPPVPLSH